MKKESLLLCFLSFSILTFAQDVNITFELNTATLGEIDPTGLYVAGGSGMGVPGDHLLEDDDGDGIYSVTVTKPVNFSSHYIFLNGICPGWDCKENIGGLPCSDPNNYGDRFLPTVTQDTTILACWGTCESTGDCTIVTDSIDITIEVNTENITVDPTGMYIAGGGHFGNPGDNQMLDPDEDGIYSITVRKPVGFTSYYTFTNGACGDWSCKEDIAEQSCAHPENYNDRLMSNVSEDTTIKACFGICQSDGTCNPVGTKDILIDESLFSLQPTIASNFIDLNFGEQYINDEKELLIANTSGQVVYAANSTFDQRSQINVSELANGIYFISVNTAKARLIKKFIVSK